jgi:hypothetical protein
VGVDVDVVTVMVEFPEPITEAGLKLALAPDGRPDALNVTVLLKPFWEVTVTVEIPWLPRASVSEVGLAEIEKFGAVPTVNVTLVEWLNAPLLPAPVIVSV